MHVPRCTFEGNYILCCQGLSWAVSSLFGIISCVRIIWNSGLQKSNRNLLWLIWSSAIASLVTLHARRQILKDFLSKKKKTLTLLQEGILARNMSTRGVLSNSRSQTTMHLVSFFSFKALANFYCSFSFQHPPFCKLAVCITCLVHIQWHASLSRNEFADKNILSTESVDK